MQKSYLKIVFQHFKCYMPVDLYPSYSANNFVNY